VDGQVKVPNDAPHRRGIQPVVSLRANDGVRADVAVGDEVTFCASAQVPEGTGVIVTVEWDLARDLVPGGTSGGTQGRRHDEPVRARPEPRARAGRGGRPRWVMEASPEGSRT